MSDTFARVGRFARLGLAEQVLFIQSLAAMIFFRAALTVVPLQRLLVLSKSLCCGSRPADCRAVGALRAAKRISQAARCCPFSTCLSESLAAHLMMSRLGYRSELRIGVAKRQAKFEAHAWVECECNLVIGNPSPEGKQYVRMPSFERFVA